MKWGRSSPHNGECWPNAADWRRTWRRGHWPGQRVMRTILDLRPVCPNCHAMLHKRTPAISIEELQGLMLQI